MGAPFSGSVDTYLYAQGWKSFSGFLSTAETGQLGHNWTSVYQLLPQWPFVTPLLQPPPSIYQVFSDNADPLSFPRLPRAPIVPDLTDPQSVWGEINGLAQTPLPFWHAIIGYGQDTSQQIVQTLQDLDTGFVFSKPCSSIQLGNGDGTVPLFSAQSNIVPTANRIYVSEQHAQLPKNGAVISGILNVLNGTSPFAVPGLLPENQLPGFVPLPDTMIIKTCSPVTISATNSGGDVISSQVSQIQNATYANIGDATQIKVPWNDIFQLQISGTASGTFDLLVNGIGGQHTSLSYLFKAVPVQKVSQGTVAIGGNSLPTIQYNYAGKNVIDTIPANVTPPTILCTGCYFTIQNLRATFAFNVGYQGGVSTFTYNYRSSSQTVQFVSTVTSQIAVSGNTATFSGQGTLNGQGGYTFAVTSTDGGPAGSGLDLVSIAITGPNGYSYTANGTVVGGDVIVHE
jgi:hypothetical protein